MIEYHKMNIFRNVTEITFDFEKDIENKFVKKVILYITEIGSTFGAMAILILAMLLGGYKIIFVFLPIYLFQLVIVETIKALLKKPRPITDTKTNLWGLKLNSGAFPSGHTSNIFTTAFLISNYFRFNITWTIIIFVLAGFIALSRMFLGKHYISDIIGGALIGITISTLGSYILSLILPNFL